MSSSRGAWHALKPCPKSLVPQLHVTENLIIGDGEDHLLVSCVICICGIVSGATRDVITMQLLVLTVVSLDSEDDDVREMYLGTATNYDRCRRLSRHVHVWVHRRHYVRRRRRAFVGDDGHVVRVIRRLEGDVLGNHHEVQHMWNPRWSTFGFTASASGDVDVVPLFVVTVMSSEFDDENILEICTYMA